MLNRGLRLNRRDAAVHSSPLPSRWRCWRWRRSPCRLPARAARARSRSWSSAATPKLARSGAAGRSRRDAVLVQNVAQGLVRFDADGNIVAGPGRTLERQRRRPLLHLPARRDRVAQRRARSPPSRSRGSSSGRSRLEHQPAQGHAWRGRGHRRDDRPGDRDPAARAAPEPPRPARPARVRDPPRRHGHRPVQARARARSGRPAPAGARRAGAATRRPRGEDEVLLDGAAAEAAIGAFAAAKADLVLGGTFADLPYAQRVKLPRGSAALRSGAGAVRAGAGARRRGVSTSPTFGGCCSKASTATRWSRRSGWRDWRRARPCSSRGSRHPGTRGRRHGSATPLAERRPALMAEATATLRSHRAADAARCSCPKGPGGDICSTASPPIGARSASRSSGRPAPAAADLRLIDAVAPSTLAGLVPAPVPLRVVPVCDPEADTLLDAARDSPVPAQRAALLAQAAGRIDDAAAVHSAHGAGALVAGFGPGPRLCREPLRPPHADRPGAEAGRRRLMAMSDR